jgi:DNA polymerase kappa
MIETTNYVGREKGVRAGMPGFIGKRLCPDLLFIKPNYGLYKEKSEIFRKVL